MESTLYKCDKLIGRSFHGEKLSDQAVLRVTSMHIVPITTLQSDILQLKQFVPEYISTIGIDYGVKTLNLEDGTEVKVNFWDVAGDPVYFEVRNEFYKDTHGAILLFDTTSRKSFEALEKWVEELMTFYTSEVAIFLVANKIDIAPRVISTKEGKNYAEKMDFA
ncbi:DnaJ sub C member 27 [Rhizoclosmatium hyalinum]|nr:DnaJ sub C member 27 [Rhizoclosmatium hyalinum]